MHKILLIGTITLGSALLFLIQPMVAKHLLPQVGGVPAVWNIVMLSFQLLLLLGYIYAHWIPTISKRYSLLHMAALWVVLLLFPVSFKMLGSPISTIELLFAIMAMVGLSFLFISANAPILQYYAMNEGMKNPYSLYVSSNIGSLIGLLSYPLFFEVWFDLETQLAIWRWGFILYSILMVCLVLKQTTFTQEKTTFFNQSISWFMRLKWVFFAFLPSSLLLAMTQYLTTDIVPMPLLWVVPLTIYLISFMVAFSDNQALFDRSINAHILLTYIMAGSLMCKFPIIQKMFLPLHFFFIFLLPLWCYMA